MTFERRLAALFRLDETGWQRHANPWSVWSRMTAAPLLVLALWSRIWLGVWALIPVAAAVLWIWINPRLFSRPRSTDSWASRAVLGERVWLQRDRVPVPPHHRRLPHVLNGVACAGAVLVGYGVILLAAWPSLLGLVLIYAGKLWFLDRMVWLYGDMRNTTAEYSAWLY